MTDKPLKPGGARRHGMSRTPEYQAWRNMRDRCANPKHRQFKDYGGRGIAVCDRWNGSFEAFLADMGERRSPRHTLERTDNSLGYEPGNCVWATRVDQARNMRTNRLVSYGGTPMTLAEACAAAGLPYDTVAFRLSKGWSEERALTEPLWSPNKPRRNPITVAFRGEVMPLKDACRMAGLEYATVAARLRAGVDAETALSRPVRRRPK